MKMSTRIIDYHLKGFIEEQNSKIALSGRTPQEKGCGLYLQRNGIGLHLRVMISVAKRI
jgi:hypothetical protein